MSPPDHPFFAGLAPTLHIAHRGGAARYPENTAYAFRQAVSRHQTQMIETDVHRTADGVIVVHHDALLDRCTDATGPIAARTWAELRSVNAAARWPDLPPEPIPTLEGVLREHPSLRFNVELKADDPALVTDFVALIRALDATSRVCCGSELDAVGAALLAAFPEGCHFLPRGPLTQWIMAVHSGGVPPPTPGYQVLDMPLEYQGVELVTPALVAAAARAGLWVNVWTVDEVPQMERLRDLGVGGIMTDRPGRLRAVLGHRPA